MCAECISDGKEAVEITEELDAGLAVDGNVNTHSCTTDSRSLPWWSVNLGAEYGILKVSVTLPNDGGGDTCNYCTTFLCSCVPILSSFQFPSPSVPQSHNRTSLTALLRPYSALSGWICA